MQNHYNYGSESLLQTIKSILYLESGYSPFLTEKTIQYYFFMLVKVSIEIEIKFAI